MVVACHISFPADPPMPCLHRHAVLTVAMPEENVLWVYGPLGSGSDLDHRILIGVGGYPK